MPKRALKHVDDPGAVGRRLKESRERAGLSQRDLAFPGCSAAYISRIEAGERTPSIQVMRELGKRLGVTDHYLATGIETPPDLDPLLDADVALRLDDVELATLLYTEALDAPEDVVRARARAGLGQIALHSGQVARAVAELESALAEYPRLRDIEPGSVEALGRAYADSGRPDAAVALFEPRVAAAVEREDGLEVVRFGVLLANALLDSGDFGRAAAILGDVLERTKDVDDPIARAKVYWSESRLHALRDDPATAARYARRALELIELTEDTRYAARAHHLLAYIELGRGRPAEALELLEHGRAVLGDAATQSERVKFALEEARALAQLGEAEAAGARAMEVSGLLADVFPFEASRAYTVLAEVYEQLGDRARARELYELAIELMEQNPHPHLEAPYARLAQLLEDDGNAQEALKVLKSAMRVRAQSAARAE